MTHVETSCYKNSQQVNVQCPLLKYVAAAFDISTLFPMCSNVLPHKAFEEYLRGSVQNHTLFGRVIIIRKSIIP